MYDHPEPTTSGLDFAALDEFLSAAVRVYEQSAPLVSRWLDDLYIRVFTTGPEHVNLAELICATNLYETEAHIWLTPHYAQNRVYKLLDRLGQDTTGWLDH